MMFYLWGILERDLSHIAGLQSCLLWAAVPPAHVLNTGFCSRQIHGFQKNLKRFAGLSGFITIFAMNLAVSLILDN